MDVWVYAVFSAAILVFLLVDLIVAGRSHQLPTMKSAIRWSIAWTALALAFTLVMLVIDDSDGAGKYLTGYLIERSLSLDNLFVFAMIFTYFAVPGEAQRRVLFFGIVGAIVLRAIFIFAGAAMLDAFHWTIYLLGALLVVTGVRMGTHDETEIHPDRNPVLRLAQRYFPMTTSYDRDRIVTKENGRRVATPMLAALIAVASFDLVFAIDSIPAIFAITTDTFIVYAANAFAMLGLMSLYFVLAGMVDRFEYLNIGLAVVLVYVGIKMLISDLWHVPTLMSLGVIVVTLGAAIYASERKVGAKETVG